MKYSRFLLFLAASAMAAGYSTSTVMEVTPEGAFATHPAGPFPALFRMTEPLSQDADLIWHYTIATGLTQKISAMGDQGYYVFTGGWYGGGKMFRGLDGDGTVYWETEPVLGDSLYTKNLATGTASAYDADAFFLVRTFDIWNDNGTPGSSGDDFLVSEDNVEVCYFLGDDPDPQWTWDGTGTFLPASPDEPGKCACTDDGSVFVVGGAINNNTGLAVFHPDSANPSLLYENVSYQYFPRQVRVTADGSKIICSVAANLLRVDIATGNLETTYNLGASTDCFAISADGSAVAYGFTSARLAQWNGSSYTQAWSYPISGYYAGAAAMSADGQKVFYGFYKNTYLSNRIIRFDAAGPTPVWTYDTPSGGGGYQDVVSWMDCTSDGGKLAVASWGCQSGGGDEVIVIADDSPAEPFFSVNSPGSMWHVDISPDGSYVCATGKHVHANVMGSGADVYMADVSQTGIEGTGFAGPLGLSLYPNPSPGSAAIGFTLPEQGNVEVSVFDLAGRRVQQMTAEGLARGDHNMPLSADLPSGLYIVSLRFGGESVSRKLVVSR